MSPWIQIIIGAISGGLMGTLVTLYFERRHRRQETAVKLAQEYQANYDLLREVTDLFLDHVNAPNSWNNEARFKVEKMGNWFEIAALLYNSRQADRKLVQKMGLTQSIHNFYHQAKTVTMLNRHVKQWDQMKIIATKKGGLKEWLEKIWNKLSITLKKP